MLYVCIFDFVWLICAHKNYTEYEIVIENEVYPKLFETINFSVSIYSVAVVDDDVVSFGLQFPLDEDKKKNGNQFGLKTYRNSFRHSVLRRLWFTLLKW